MKRIIIGLSGLILVAFVVIKVANAQDAPKDVKKATTEASMDCGKCPSVASCGTMPEVKKTGAKLCDPAKCKEMGCDPAKCKEGKCDPATCKAVCATANGGTKKCNPGMCSGAIKK